MCKRWISQIADEVEETFENALNPAAKTYINAMKKLNTPHDFLHGIPAKEIVHGFLLEFRLLNSRACEIRQELKDMFGGHI